MNYTIFISVFSVTALTWPHLSLAENEINFIEMRRKSLLSSTVYRLESLLTEEKCTFSRTDLQNSTKEERKEKTVHFDTCFQIFEFLEQQVKEKLSKNQEIGNRSDLILGLDFKKEDFNRKYFLSQQTLESEKESKAFLLQIERTLWKFWVQGIWKWSEESKKTR